MSFHHHFNVSVAAPGKGIQTSVNAATLELPWVPEVLFLFFARSCETTKA